MNGADRKSLFEAEFGEFDSASFSAARVPLVDRNEYRFAAAPKPAGSLSVKGDDAFLDVDDENDDVGGFDGEFDLFQGRAGDDIVSFFAAKQPNAAGVDESES